MVHFRGLGVWGWGSVLLGQGSGVMDEMGTRMINVYQQEIMDNSAFCTARLWILAYTNKY